MKRFCTHCGSQLNFSQQLCSCGATNQFYGIEVAEAKEPAEAAQQHDTLQALVAKRREIEAEREKKQAELDRKEELKRELAEIERQREERLEKVRQIKEKFEQQEKAAREEAENALKREIQTVKLEAEQYKAETLAVLSDLRRELQQIEEENKLLKQEFEALTREQQVYTEVKPLVAESIVEEPVIDVAEPHVTETRSKALRLWVPVALVAASLALVVGATLFYLQPDGPVAKPVAATPVNNTPVNTNASTNASQPATVTPVKLPVKGQGAKVLPLNPSEPLKPAAVFPATLTTYKIKKDLLGRRLAGCDIAIRSFAEITSVSEPQLIETLGSGQLKYKCSLTILQDGETYHASPYIYYSPAGQVVKVDGTTCE